MGTISLEQYLRKLRGCFVGKAVGGTLGMPMEGQLTPKPFTYYDPVPTGMVANDDLDLQVVWLECLRRYGLPVNRHHLGKAWQEHVRFGPDEYGTAMRNLASGLCAPLTGLHASKFTDGMGAAIRSEIWASLAPGDPALAVKLCREDAVVDHAGNGVDACIFLTAIESAAYICADRDALIEQAMGFITPDGRLASALRDTRRWWDEKPDYLWVRGQILQNYKVDNWTDVTINLSLIELAWLAGGGDFSRSICIAAEMGYDADCTCATLGSILGMIDPDGIEERWTRPIGDTLVVSDYMAAMHAAPTIDRFCEQLAAMAWQVQNYYDSRNRFDAEPEPDAGAAAPFAHTDRGITLADGYDVHTSLIAVEPYAVQVTYPQNVLFAPGETKVLQIQVINPNGGVCTKLLCGVPYGWQVEPQELQLNAADGEAAQFALTVTAPTTEDVPPRNWLQLGFETGCGIRFSTEAGLLRTRPWIRCGGKLSADCAERVHAGITVPVPAGEQYYALDIVFPYRESRIALICEGTRPLTVWFDGEQVLDHAAEMYVPAIHRSGHCALLDVAPGTHKVVIRVADGGAGEFFFDMGSPRNWLWQADQRHIAYAFTDGTRL